MPLPLLSRTINMDPDWWNLEIDSILFWKLTPSGRRRKIQSYVALEFGFPKDLVRDVLMANDFPTSGDLVNYLSCLEDDVDHQKAHKAQVAEMHEAMRERTAKREEERQRAEEEFHNKMNRGRQILPPL